MPTLPSSPLPSERPPLTARGVNFHLDRCISHSTATGPVQLPTRKRQRASAPKRPAANTAPARRLALLIGNARVRDGNGKGFALNIPGVDKDVASLAEVLEDSESAGFEVRRLMEPTLIDVRREIARAAIEVGPADTLLVYYSGTSMLGTDNLLYLPVSDSDINFLEATCLDSEYVLSWLRRSRGRRQLLLMDGCHSGAFFAFNRGIPDGFCAIMSCARDEYCYSDQNGGFFTRLLVEGLRGATADVDGDGVVNTDELFRYVLPRAKAQDPPTTPQVWSWNLPEPIPLTRVRLRVFFSYRRTNSQLADTIAKQLEDHGYGVWIDRADIGGGTKWRSEIDTAQQQSDAVILLLSKAALDSDEIYVEVARAVELGKPIIPLVIGTVELHGWYKEKLGGIQQISCSEKQIDAEAYGRIVAALKQTRRSRILAAAASSTPSAAPVALSPPRAPKRCIAIRRT